MSKNKSLMEKRSLITVEKTVVYELVHYHKEIDEAFITHTVNDYRNVILEILNNVPHTKTQKVIVENFNSMNSKEDICSYMYSLILAGDNNKVIRVN